MGAWIEILIYIFAKKIKKVAPHMGAWIEIGLKSSPCFNVAVAPYTGAWIEIFFSGRTFALMFGRTLHGCVD